MMNSSSKLARKCGVLLPVFSLPSPYGGGFGYEAFDFVEFLALARQSYWQVLPLCPADEAGSPYKSECSFALDCRFISPDVLEREGLLTAEEKGSLRLNGGIYEKQDCDGRRHIALRAAFERFKNVPLERYETFKTEQSYWLDDYALYLALKSFHNGKPWGKWEEPYRLREGKALSTFSFEHAEELEFYKFVQYLADKQWAVLKNYAAARGVKLIGDLPIYADYDSSDVWANAEQFMLDKDLKCQKVAGVPPDDFNEDGQLWGNPVYDFDRAAFDGYSFFEKRLKRAEQLYDVVRLDHFRAFESFYAVEAGSKNARCGEWLKGPGVKLFEALSDLTQGEGLQIIAEDLGFIDEKVKLLLKQTGFAGMKVLQFGLDGDDKNEHLPANYPLNCAAYTGTHDNDTLKGFYSSLNGRGKRTAKRQIGCPPFKNFTACAVEALLKSRAFLAIVPLADYLNLGGEARINRPGEVSPDNWSFALKEPPRSRLAYRMATLAEKHGRV